MLRTCLLYHPNGCIILTAVALLVDSPEGRTQGAQRRPPRGAVTADMFRPVYAGKNRPPACAKMRRRTCGRQSQGRPPFVSWALLWLLSVWSQCRRDMFVARAVSVAITAPNDMLRVITVLRRSAAPPRPTATRVSQGCDAMFHRPQGGRPSQRRPRTCAAGAVTGACHSSRRKLARD